MSPSAPTLASLAEGVLGDRQVPEEINLLFDDCPVRVTSNSGELAERLRRYFRAFAVPPQQPEFEIAAIEMEPPVLPVDFVDWPRDPGKTGRKDTICDVAGGRALRKVRTGMQFLVGPGIHIAFGPCLRNPNQVINFVISQFMARQRRRGWEICHGAGVTVGGAGIGISAFSGGGKSTLALHLISRGAQFVSNDRLLIRRGSHCEMAGVPKMPRVNPGTLLNNPDLVSVLPPERRAALADLPKAELWALEEKYDVDIETAFGPGRLALSAPLDLYIVLDWSPQSAAPFCLRPVDLAKRSDLLDAVMKPPGAFVLPGSGGRDVRTFDDLEPADYLSRLEGVRILEATGRADFAAACKAIEAEIETVGSV